MAVYQLLDQKSLHFYLFRRYTGPFKKIRNKSHEP